VFEPPDEKRTVDTGGQRSPLEIRLEISGAAPAVALLVTFWRRETMRLSALVTLAASSLVFTLVACSAPPPATSKEGKAGSADRVDTETDTDGTDTPAKPGDTKAPTGGTTTGTDPAPAGGGEVCSAAASLEACYECCEAKAPGVAAKAAELEKTWKACACQASRCGTACKTDYCADADPEADAADAACIACLDDEAKLKTCNDADDAAYEALESDPAYASVDACATEHKCDAKPADGGEE
jgi:hypothetical protein